MDAVGACSPTPGHQDLRAPLGVNDGRGVVFISHTGDVQPSGFLNLVGGNIRSQSLADIYRDSPVFRACATSRNSKASAACANSNVCGGSRSRAYAITGDPMRSDPYCVYQPAAWQARRSRGKTTSRSRGQQEHLN